MKLRACCAIAFIFFSVSVGIATPDVDVSGTSVAVIVNSDNPVDELSMAELQRIVLGEKRSWNTKTPIVLMMRNGQSRGRNVILQKVCRMSETEYHQYWTGKIFRGEVTSEPVVVPSLGTALNFVSSIKGGISFVETTGARQGIKVLRIAGHLPTEPGYPLQ